MSAHTPGPWKSHPSLHGSQYRSVQIGADETYSTLEVEPADAYLIAASPDMYAALRSIADYAQEQITDLFAHIQEGGEWLDSDRANLSRWNGVLSAIAKAEGR